MWQAKVGNLGTQVGPGNVDRFSLHTLGLEDV